MRYVGNDEDSSSVATAAAQTVTAVSAVET